MEPDRDAGPDVYLAWHLGTKAEKWKSEHSTSSQSHPIKNHMGDKEIELQPLGLKRRSMIALLNLQYHYDDSQPEAAFTTIFTERSILRMAVKTSTVSHQNQK